MNRLLASQQSSPLCNAFFANTSLEKLMYNFNESLPPMARSKHYIDSPRVFDFGQTAKYEIPRHGLNVAAVWRLAVDFDGAPYVAAANGNPASNKRIKPSFNSGSMAMVKAVLTSNGREVEQILDGSNLCELNELPYEMKSILQDLTHDQEDSVIEEVTTKYYYVPLFFSCYKNLGSALNTRFMENLAIMIEARNKNKLFIAQSHSGTASSGDWIINADQTKLMLWYYDMDEATFRKLMDDQYGDLQKPLSMAWNSTFRETPVQFSGTAPLTTTVGGVTTTTYYPVTVAVDFTCKNVIKKSCFFINSNDNGDVGNFSTIDKIEIYLDGRLFYEQQTNDETRLENALFFSHSLNPNNDNIYNYHWEICDDGNQSFCGGISGEGLGNIQVRITLTPSATNTYYLNTIHTYANVVSVSGQSGKIVSTLSI